MESVCATCDTAVPDGARFCPACGAIADGRVRCACGGAIPPDARFCPACGTAAAGDVATPETHAERRPVTVLFADAVGSTAFTERAGDEAAYRFAQQCVARMSEAVERNGGTITQFRGDGIMALFGAPIAKEQSAVAAVTAALEIQQALEELRGECEFRVGLSTGPVVVGRVGDDVLLDYTAIGDTANVAARMEQTAVPGSVYVSDTTWRAVREFIECRPVGDLEVKGKAKPVAAYEALRRRPIRTRLEAAVERGLGPFVGRSRDLDVLLGIIDELPAGHGHVVEITGEAGIGKSRLLLELRQRLPDTVGWSEGHCSASAKDAPYLPIADLLRNSFGIEELDDPATIIERIDASAVAWTREAQLVVPYLKYVLDIDPGDDDVLMADARQRRAGIIDALQAAFLDAGRRQPRVVVIEDVHWADAASLEVLRALADTVARAGVLLITTSRPGYDSPFGDRSRHTRLALDSLSPEASRAITAGVLDVSEVPADVAALIAGRSEGNPLFVEELTASLIESGVLVTDGSACHLTMAARDVDVPGTVQDVILARIDRLEREARDALQLAAVIGREFTVRLLDRLTGMRDGLDGALDELKAVELIRQTAWFPELAYLFKHALTHEVTYATLLDERRRSLHRLVAEAIEEVYADRVVEHVERLAHHWSIAEEWARALTYLEQAADNAAASFANDAAVSFYEQAIEVAQRIGEDADALAMYQRLGDVRFATGDLLAAADVFGRMSDLARRARDPEARSWALAYQGQALCYVHDWRRGLPCFVAALDVDGASKAPRLYAADFLHTLQIVFGWHDEAAESAPMVAAIESEGVEHPRVIAVQQGFSSLRPRWRGELQTCLEMTRHDPPDGTDLFVAQSIFWVRGMTMGELGGYDTGLTTLTQLVAQSRVTGELMFQARALNTIGWIRGDLGDHAGCIEWNERCLAFLREVDLPDEEIESNARLNLAESHLSVGDLAAAAIELERVEEIVRGKPVRGTWMLWRFSQRLHLLAAALRLYRGEVSSIGSRIDDCIALAEESGSVKYRGKAARLQGRLLLVSGELDGAVEQAELSLGITTRLGHPPDLWRTHALLADIANARGDRDAAGYHFGVADETLATVEAALADPAGRAGIARLRAALR